MRHYEKDGYTYIVKEDNEIKFENSPYSRDYIIDRFREGFDCWTISKIKKCDCNCPRCGNSEVVDATSGIWMANEDEVFAEHAHQLEG